MTEEAQIRELKEKMALERGKLLAVLERLSEAEADTPPKPGEWNAKQQMSHLCEMEAAYRARVERALNEDGAALDVTDPEPISPKDPLLALDNVVLAPHIASASVATRGRMAMLAAENLLAALAGRLPKDTVNREIARTWRAARRRRLPSPS